MIDIIKVMFHSSRWEDRLGAIQGSIVLIKKFYIGDTVHDVDAGLKDFVWNTIRSEKIQLLMLDNEFRVRNEIGPLLRQMILAD